MIERVVVAHYRCHVYHCMLIIWTISWMINNISRRLIEEIFFVGVDFWLVFKKNIK